MTAKEIEKAYRNNTWLVDTPYSRLVQVNGILKESTDDDRWWVCTSSGTRYWLHQSVLKVATAKDILELSDD